MKKKKTRNKELEHQNKAYAKAYAIEHQNKKRSVS
jgi:hypothetical protein